MTRTILMLTLCWLLGSNCRIAAQTRNLGNNPSKNSLDSAVARIALVYLQEEGTHSIVIGIVRNGLRYAYHYGENVKGSGQLPSSDLYYNIGSVAKTFVATLLAQAVVEKKIDLYGDIRHYLLGKYPILEYQGHVIHVVDLANHNFRFARHVS